MNIPTYKEPTPEEKIQKAEKSKYDYSYFRVITDFKRTSEPIFVLATLESKKILKIDRNEIYFKTDDEVQQILKEFVETHFEESNGELEFWKNIKSYVWYQNNKQKYKFNVDNMFKCEEITEEINIPEATLTI